MRAAFSVEVEPEHDLMHITLSGFFDKEMIDQFNAARRPAFSRLSCPPNHHVSLLNISGCCLQSQDVVRAFQELMDQTDPAFISRKMAVVTGSSLAWMQARRIIKRDCIACFQTEEEGRTWLLSQDS